MDENAFENIVTETLNDLNNIEQNSEGTNEEVQDVESAPTLEDNAEDSSLNDENNEELEPENEADEDNVLDLEAEEGPSDYQKDNQAFARMRTELKQANNDLEAAKSVIQFFDVRAKQMGLDGIQDLMEKTVESELNKQAQKEGVPVDVLRRINELEDKVQQQDIERNNLIRGQKEREVNHTFDTFMQKHSLSSQDLNKMANDLVKDGFSFDALMNMPSSAVTKILNSYLPETSLKQEDLAKKEQIRKEVPHTGNTSSGSNAINEIDKIAKTWANGGY